MKKRGRPLLKNPLTEEAWAEMMLIGRTHPNKAPKWVVAELVNLKLVRETKKGFVFTIKGRKVYHLGMKQWLAMGVS